MLMPRALRLYPELEPLFRKGLLAFEKGYLRLNGFHDFEGLTFDVRKICVRMKENGFKEKVIALETDGPRLEFWVSQQKLLTPLDPAWYRFEDNLYAKPPREKLLWLTKKAVEKAGSKIALEHATGWHRHQITRVMRGKQGSLRILNLRSLLTYLDKKYNWIGKTFICHSRGNPIELKSFDKNSRALMRLLGALTGDGSITKSKRENSYLIEYTTYDEELKELRSTDFKTLFSGINIMNKYQNGKCTGFKIRSAAIGEILSNLGAPVGDKIELDPPLPWIVRFASNSSQIEYVRSVFTDEGYVSSPSSGKQVQVAYSRAGRLLLNSDHMQMLGDAFESCSTRVNLPSGSKQWVATPKRLFQYFDALQKSSQTKGLLELIQNRFEVFLPKLLKMELTLLSSVGFNPRLSVANLHTSKKDDGYTATWVVHLYRKKDVIRFYLDGGFLGKGKQATLEEKLRKVGWIP